MNRLADEYRSISTVVLQRIVGLAMVCLAVIASVHAWSEREHQREQFHSAMGLIIQNSSHAMAIALWDIDSQALEHHMQRLGELPIVSHVLLEVHTSGQQFEAGQHQPSHSIHLHTASIYSPLDRDFKLGTLTVYANTQYYDSLLWQSQKRLLLGYVLFTLLICLVVAWVIRRDLGEPLHQIANFANNLTPDDLQQPLQIRRQRRRTSDEIDLVMRGFEHLQTALDKHIRHLDERVRERTSELNAVLEEIQHLSLLDALTGAFNRRAMEQRLPQEIERSARYGRPLCVIFADIDHFKKINDRYGHQVGDAVIQAFVQRLHQQLRANLDWVVRFGGEEFIIFMPETELGAAVETAERLAHAMRAQPVHAQHTTVPITSSFGVAQFHPPENMHALLARADSLLYRAKAQGRDCVCHEAVAAPPLPAKPQATPTADFEESSSAQSHSEHPSQAHLS